MIDFDCNVPQFKKRVKRTGPSYFLLKVLQRFRETNKRDPNYKTRDEDMKQLLAIRTEIADNLVPDSALVHVFAQISPATAIVGGELAQEVIKTVSKSEAPHLNVFLFDPETCCGFVETIAVQ